MDQWSSKFSESFSLDRYWSIECSSLEGGRNNRKGGTAGLRSRTCVKRNAVFSARFQGLSLYFLYQKENLIRIKTGLDTYLIRIQTRTPLSRCPLYDCHWSKKHYTHNFYFWGN